MKDFIAAFSAHDVEKVLPFFTDDIFYEEVAAGGAVVRGKEELRARIQGLFRAFPDIELELTSYFSSGDRECVEWISSGTHTVDSPGLPATGKRFSYREVVLIERRDGKIRRLSLFCDMMTFMQQIGVLPPSPL